MQFLLYVTATLAALVSLMLFLFGRLFGGVLDPDAAAAARISDEEARARAVQALAAPTTPVGKIGRFLNAMGDNLQRASGLAFFFSALAIAAFAGVMVWTEGRHLFILVVAILAAGNMLYYLSAEPAQRAKRAIVVSTMLTVIAVGAILIQVGFKNNAEWYTPQVITKTVTVGAGKDVLTENVKAATTPNATYLDLQKVVGGDGDRAEVSVERTHLVCLVGFNSDLAGYETRCDKGVLKMRAQRAKPHSFNLARGEYNTLEELVLAREEDRIAALALKLDVKETKAVLAKRAERLEAGKIPLLARFSTKEIAFVAFLILVGFGLLAYTHEEKKPEAKPEEKKPTDPKAAAPKAA